MPKSNAVCPSCTSPIQFAWMQPNICILEREKSQQWGATKDKSLDRQRGKNKMANIQRNTKSPKTSSSQVDMEEKVITCPTTKLKVMRSKSLSRTTWTIWTSFSTTEHQWIHTTCLKAVLTSLTSIIHWTLVLRCQKIHFKWWDHNTCL